METIHRPKRQAAPSFDRLDRRDVPAVLTFNPLGPGGFHSIVSTPSGMVGFNAFNPFGPGGFRSIRTTPSGPVGFNGFGGVAVNPIGAGGFHSIVGTPSGLAGFNGLGRFGLLPTPFTVTPAGTLVGGFGATPFLKRGPVHFTFMNP